MQFNLPMDQQYCLRVIICTAPAPESCSKVLTLAGCPGVGTLVFGDSEQSPLKQACDLDVERIELHGHSLR